MLNLCLRPITIGITLVALLLAPLATIGQEAPRQPVQPESGPGGSDYQYDDVLAQHYGPEPDGAADPAGYWIFEPAADGSPAEETLPVVLFLHGFGAVDPVMYQDWIDHLVRRGSIVIYPDFHAATVVATLETVGQVGRVSLPYIQTAMAAASDELARGDHARPAMDQIVAVGHSLGATLMMDYAGTAEAEGLPVPTALMAALPGCGGCQLEALATIPPQTRVLVVAGDVDYIVGEETARRMWAGLTAVPFDRRDYVRLRSDDHGQPPIVADHFVPLTAGFDEAYVDSADWFGTWKLFDALMACTFTGAWCDHALGNTPEQLFMGEWSDGVPVATAEVLPEPE